MLQSTNNKHHVHEKGKQFIQGQLYSSQITEPSDYFYLKYDCNSAELAVKTLMILYN